MKRVMWTLVLVMGLGFLFALGLGVLLSEKTNASWW